MNIIYRAIDFLRTEGIWMTICKIAFAIQRSRQRLAYKYIRWEGIEIGALYNPLHVDSRVAQVKYVDYKTTSELRASYPELNSLNLVNVDYIWSAEDLSVLPDSSQDFIIANHVFEHLKNPIATLIGWNRVLMNDAIVYLAIPEKTRTFDKNRPITELSHILSDYEAPSIERDFGHYCEFAPIYYPDITWASSDIIKERAKKMISDNVSIHYHVFTQELFSSIIDYCNRQGIVHFEVVEIKWLTRNPADNEFIFVLKSKKIAWKSL